MKTIFYIISLICALCLAGCQTTPTIQPVVITKYTLPNAPWEALNPPTSAPKPPDKETYVKAPQDVRMQLLMTYINALQRYIADLQIQNKGMVDWYVNTKIKIEGMKDEP